MKDSYIYDDNMVVFYHGMPFSFLIVGNSQPVKVFTIDMINKRMTNMNIIGKDVFNTMTDANNYVNKIPNHENPIIIGNGLIGCIINENQLSILCITKATKVSNLDDDLLADIFQIESVNEYICSFKDNKPLKLFANYPIPLHYIFSPNNDLSKNVDEKEPVEITCWNKKFMAPFGEKENVCIPIYQALYRVFRCFDVKVGFLLRNINDFNWIYEIIIHQVNTILELPPVVITLKRSIGIYSQCDENCIYIPCYEERKLIDENHLNVFPVIKYKNSSRELNNQFNEKFKLVKSPLEIVSKCHNIDVDIMAMLYGLFKLGKLDYYNDLIKSFIENMFIRSAEFISRMDIGVAPEDMKSMIQLTSEGSKYISSEVYTSRKEWEAVRASQQLIEQIKSDKLFIPPHYLTNLSSNWDFQSPMEIGYNSKPILICLPFELNIRSLHFLIPKQDTHEQVKLSVSIGNNKKSMMNFFNQMPFGIPCEKSWVSFDFDNIEKTALTYPSDGRVSSGIFVQIYFETAPHELFRIDGLIIEVSKCTNKEFKSLSSGKGELENQILDRKSFANIMNFASYCLDNDISIRTQVKYIIENKRECPSPYILKALANKYSKSKSDRCINCGKWQDPEKSWYRLNPPYLALEHCEKKDGEICICERCLPMSKTNIGKYITTITQKEVTENSNFPIFYSYPENCQGDPNLLFTSTESKFIIPQSDKPKHFKIIFPKGELVSKFEILFESRYPVIFESIDLRVTFSDIEPEEVNITLDKITADFKGRNIHKISFKIECNSTVTITKFNIVKAKRLIAVETQKKCPVMDPYIPIPKQLLTDFNTDWKNISVNNLRDIVGLDIKGSFCSDISFCVSVFDDKNSSLAYLDSIIPATRAKSIRYLFPHILSNLNGELGRGSIKVFFLNCPSKNFNVAVHLGRMPGNVLESSDTDINPLSASPSQSGGSDPPLDLLN